MSKVIVPLNAFNVQDVLEKGQESFFQIIHASEANGVEIRRELFPKVILPLSCIREELTKYPLFTVYSAPVELWKNDGSINLEDVQQIFQEADQIGASWLKVSLGHFCKEKSDVQLLKQILLKEGNIQLLVENDQTIYGGNIQNLKSFFEEISKNDVPVKMTFDIGNWFYSGESVQEAIESLKEYVIYLHLKHVENRHNRLITLPLPTNESAQWRKAVEQFPTNLNRALEFPIQPSSQLALFVKLVGKRHEKVGKKVCSS
ncbi:sugar phosphate isomerase/epimerase [Neobacillus sp. PS3-40]|uniref:sugar phosphate isomerase/epimerase family protein n=1 Tax=Neobacillus sp. PS3-40 TaxID=3070679 RepID=UPI0027E1F9A2|nr:sugar phosphate isomerase/epimerase [Neobacillus sp. PS3-40]WML43151.1 sugar phosphate isomerase/epimerase [Neobacillus sp. PS3-40]